MEGVLGGRVFTCASQPEGRRAVGEKCGKGTLVVATPAPKLAALLEDNQGVHQGSGGALGAGVALQRVVA